MSTNRPAGRRRPPVRGQPLYTPDASRARQSVERRSAAPLLFLRQLPVWLMPLVLVVLLIAGLAVHGIAGALALCGVALVLGWLALVSWPRLSPAGRLARILVLALVLVGAVIQATK
ncbi:MAG TPA: DUF6703 family protein [Streptosporangiaceae bacterium]|jgi:hypothetical protein